MNLSTLTLLPTLISVCLATFTIHEHFLNYRKPQQQRLIVRILLILPIYSIVCYTSLAYPKVSRLLEPLREIYEAFVIYTFFSLLTDYLDGEKNIVVMSSGRAPVSHPWPMNLTFKAIDISDPFDLLMIKRGILQYVWLKPFICLSLTVSEVMDWDLMMVWANVGYNISVSISLYELAMFWKCLYKDLEKFNPWGKFLCVKLIIFASYWQGLIISILKYFKVLNSGETIQNVLMSFELIGFAIGHYYSFSYKEYIPKVIPGSGRLPYYLAIKDPFGIVDLKYDFKKVLFGSGYNYKEFDSVESIIAHPNSNQRMNKFNKGFRVSQERGKYWIDQNTPLLKAESIMSNSSMIPNYSNSINEDIEEIDISDYVSDIKIFEKAKKERPFGDLNSPVVFDKEEHNHTFSMERRRREVWSQV